jgi:hypothetical protein
MGYQRSDEGGNAAVTRVWLKAEGEVLVRADRIYDISCRDRSVTVCAGPASKGEYLTYNLVTGNFTYIPEPASVYTLIEVIAAAEASGDVCVISAKPLPESDTAKPNSNKTKVVWTVRRLGTPANA